MDTKWKKISHSYITKLIVFVLVVVCFTGAIKNFVDGEVVTDGYLNNIFEENYYQSHAFSQESDYLIDYLYQLVKEYKNEEHIRNGGTISENERKNIEDNLFYGVFQESPNYITGIPEEENRQKFKELYTTQIEQEIEQVIKTDLTEYHRLVKNLIEYEEILFYASDGTNTFTNTTMTDEVQFAKYPAYFLFGNFQRIFYPNEWVDNQYFSGAISSIDELDAETDIMYIAFTKPYLDAKITDWEQSKAIAKTHFNQLIGFMAGLVVSLLYLILVIGRKSFKDHEIRFHFMDKLYTDINLLFCMILIASWLGLVDFVFEQISQMVVLITLPIAAVGLILVLSLVKHVKNRTVFKHSLIYQVIYKIVLFFKGIYDSGSIAVKTVLIVVGYPLLVAVTFFMFPITLGVAAWFALKKVKSFQAIQKGVERIKEGDLHHRIEVEGKGEFFQLASNINHISEGLETAVESELKSERLKTELITNVSHDIRTPLTSIITYVDLLKNEKDPEKITHYVSVLDQKSQRLKGLTDDLFDAAKASSGNMPVELVEIDIVSLLSQGLGEVNDKIEASQLEFKLRHPDHKVYMKADGKLLWRSIENLLSNIFKYAMKGSRVYIDIEDNENEILVTFKNISAYELNISEEELMERFKRADDSRSSQGSGLGLSIAKSLIELQKGKFHIQIDGDLFKAIIRMPK